MNIGSRIENWWDCILGGESYGKQLRENELYMMKESMIINRKRKKSKEFMILNTKKSL